MSFINYLEQRLFSEIRKSSLENIDLERNLLFGNLFGDKLRILIPLENSDDLEKLINFLEENGYEVDYEDLVNKKVAYKIIKTQQGTKKRPEKIGGILQSFTKNSSNNRLSFELLDWWQKNSEKLKNNSDGHSIIISRSPIDIVRMSDHDGISSCHSPDNSYFKCAKQEARTGGAVAYVVSNEDLKGVDLQRPEIFKDKDRKVDGIEPLERLRLRRFSNDDKKMDLLVPELRSYGTSHIGLKKIIKNWAKLAQKDTLDQIDATDDYSKFELKGGSYQDSNASNVWNDFLNTKVSGGKNSSDEEEEREGENSAEDMEEQAQRQLDEHRPSWNHFSVDFSVEENDNTPYLYYSANVSFSIPVSEIGENFPSINYLNKSSFVQLRKIEDIIKKNIDIYQINNVDWSVQNVGNKPSYIVSLSIHDEDGDGDVNSFEHFLDYIDDSDNGFEGNIRKVYIALSEEGYLKNQDLAEKLEFKNFDVEYDDDEGEYSVISKPIKIGFVKDFTGEVRSTVGPEGTRVVLSFMKEKLSLIGSTSLVPYIKNSQIEIFVSKSTSTGWADDPRTDSGDARYNPNYKADEPSKAAEFVDPKQLRIQIPSPQNKKSYTGPGYVSVRKDIPAFDSKEKGKLFAQIKHLDENWITYLKKVATFFDFSLKAELQQSQSKDAAWADALKSNAAMLKKPSVPRPTKDPQKKLSFREFVLESEGLLTESFDSAVQFTIAGHGGNWQEYKFKIKDREFTVEFVSKNDADDYELIFSDEEGSLDKTGKGDALSVFTTVFDITKQFIKSHNPKIIRFTAKNDRESLYNTLSKKLSNQIGYDLSFSKLSNEKEYVLSKGAK